MNNKGNLYSTFFLLFGLFFTALIYVGIKFIPLFSYLNANKFIPLVICLVLLILFVFIAFFSKQISFLCIKLKLCLNKNKDVAQLSKEIATEKSRVEISTLVSKFRKVINTLVIKKYSNESINSLMTSVGVDNDTAANVILTVKKHRKIRKLIYFLGLFVSITIYFVIVYSPFTQFITNPFSPLLVSFVVFVLFSLESILVTKMPDSFYIKLMNINQERIIDINNKMLLQSRELENTKLEVSKTLDNLSQIISYLLSVGINKSDATKILTRYGLSEPVAKDFIEKVDLKNKNNSSKKAPALKNMLKLSLTKVHEDFISLQELYSKMKILNSQVTTLSQKQNQLETIVREKKIIINSNPINSDVPVTKLIPKLKIPFENDKKYQEMLEVLYNLLAPYAKENTKNRFISILVSTGYSYEIACDLSDKFEKSNVFKKKKNVLELIVDLINGSYEQVSKKNK